MYIDIKHIDLAERQAWLQHAVAPRPIALASTIDAAGNVNLSPFSFFNLFSFDPAILIFSPSRRVRDNSTKHTLQNVLEVAQVVIHICDYEMLHQVSLSSCDFPKAVSEFEKAGFTMEQPTIILPPMVKEAKIKLECEVLDVHALGVHSGAGNLVICEVLCIHVDDSILNEAGTMIDQLKIQQISRLGGDYYSVNNPQNLITVEKPNRNIGVGIDCLPENIRNSQFLNNNHLAQLAKVAAIPECDHHFDDERLEALNHFFNGTKRKEKIHTYALELLDMREVWKAWQVLLTEEKAFCNAE